MCLSGTPQLSTSFVVQGRSGSAHRPKGCRASLRAGALIHLSGLGNLSVPSLPLRYLLCCIPWSLLFGSGPYPRKPSWAFGTLAAPLRQSPESEPLGPARTLASPPGPSGPWLLPSRFAPLSHGISPPAALARDAPSSPSEGPQSHAESDRREVPSLESICLPVSSLVGPGFAGALGRSAAAKFRGGG